MSKANFIKYAKLGITIIGALLMIANEALPLVPSTWQHWVTGAIAVLTVALRDITDIVNGLVPPAAAKGPKPSAGSIVSTKSL